MDANLLLPASIFTLLAISVLAYGRLAERIRGVFGGKKIGMHEAAAMVAFIGGLVFVIAIAPGYAIQALFLAALSYTLFIFTYIVSRKAIIAAAPPVAFVATYVLLNNIMPVEDIMTFILATNVFSATFAVAAVTLLGPLFTWRVLLLFAALLTAMDVIHVFVTGHMVQAAQKIVGLGLPLILLLPRLPSLSGITVLGLGDIFLSGLVSVQMASKYSRRDGLITAASISLVFLAFDIIVFNLHLIQYVRFFPATILVLLGWLLGRSPYALKKLWEGVYRRR